MKGTPMVARDKTLFNALLAGAVLMSGCADLSLEGDRIPTELTITPESGRVSSDEPTRLQLVVRDQNDRVVRTPNWAPAVWTVSDGSVS